MKMRVTMIADMSLIPSIVTGVALGKIEAETLDIQPVFANGGDRREAIKKAFVATNAKRKVGRPKMSLSDRIVAAVRNLQKGPDGAALDAIKKRVKNSGVGPAITHLIKSKKLVRTRLGHYKVA